MSEQTNVELPESDAEFFADPKKNKRIFVPALDTKAARGWIEVREEVSIGEERKIFGSAFKGEIPTPDGPRRDYDMERISFGTTALHMTGWSLSKKYSPDALKALKAPLYKAIDDAVQAHIDKVKEGKAPSPSETGDSLTSASAA